MTQEKIAELLGVRREGVTASAGDLRNRGAIDYHRGQIRILDREKLEALSCECYAVVKSQCDSLQPSALHPATLNGVPRPAAKRAANVSAARINGSGNFSTYAN